MPCSHVFITVIDGSASNDGGLSQGRDYCPEINEPSVFRILSQILCTLQTIPPYPTSTEGLNAPDGEKSPCQGRGLDQAAVQSYLSESSVHHKACQILQGGKFSDQ